MSRDIPTASLRSVRTRLIGREADVRAVAQSLQRDDLAVLTIVGPGGAGKTRLAREVAVNERHAFADGVIFVDLSTVTAGSMVMSQVAQALEITEAPNVPPVDLVAGHLKERSLLLVLDEFEHVMSAAADVEKLVSACTGLKVLITSRAPLGIPDEHQFIIRLLQIPDPPETSTSPSDEFNEAQRSSAVELFCERATAADPAFELTSGNVREVGEICRQLDGLPLAIEIAATWTRLLSPPELLRRIEDALTLEPLVQRASPARHQTLRDTVAWSYGLLRPEEQQVFRRLGVFPGGLSLDAVSAVCSWEGDVTADPLPTVAALLNQSLLVTTHGAAGTTRIRMLETVRAYARRELEASDESTQAQRVLVDFAVALAEEAGPHLVLADRTSWLRRLTEEEGNIRAALGVCVENDWAEPAMRIMGALWHRYRFRFREALEWLSLVLSLPGAQSPTLARGWALHSAAIASWGDGDFRSVKRRATECVAIARHHEDHSLLTIGLCLLGAGAETKEELHTAFQGALEAAAQSHLTWPAERCYRSYASCALRFGEAEVALDMATRILTTGDPQNAWNRAMGLSLGGQARLQLGDIATARAELRSAVAGLREPQDRWALAHALLAQGVAAALERDWPEATAMFVDATKLSLTTSEMPSLAAAVEGLAVCFANAGMVDESNRALCAVAKDTPPEVSPVSLPPEAWRAILAELRNLQRPSPNPHVPSLPALARQCIVHAEKLAQKAPQTLHNPEGLSAREMEVLRLMALGKSNKAIAESLFLSVRTVEKHIANIYGKAGIGGRAEAALLATRMGLLG